MERQPFINTPAYLATLVTEGRSILGLSQTELAGKANVDLQFVKDLEDGRPRAQQARVLRVMEALNTVPRALPAFPLGVFDKEGRMKDEFFFSLT